MKDFLFVDEVSGMPLDDEEKELQGPIHSRLRRYQLGTLLVASVALVILLFCWAFS